MAVKYGYEPLEEHVQIGILRKGNREPIDKKEMTLEIDKIISKTDLFYGQDGFLKCPYEQIYSLYFEQEEKETQDGDTYKLEVYRTPRDCYTWADLPHLFQGYIKVDLKNGSNPNVTDQVLFSVRYYNEGDLVPVVKRHKNIISFANHKFLLDEQLFHLVEALEKYHHLDSNMTDVYSQYEVVQRIKQALDQTSLYISPHLDAIEEPILVDEIELKADEIETGIVIMPLVSDDPNIQSQFEKKFLKEGAAPSYKVGNRRIIFKNLDTIKKVHQYRKPSKKDLQEIAMGEHLLNFAEGLSLDGVFSPRVKGIGIITLKDNISKNSSGQDWFDAKFDAYCPALRSDDGETIQFEYEDLDSLKDLLDTPDDTVLIEKTLKDRKHLIPADKNQLKQLIQEIEQSVVEVEHIKNRDLLDELEHQWMQNPEKQFQNIRGKTFQVTEDFSNRLTAQKERLSNDPRDTKKVDDKVFHGLDIYTNNDQIEYTEGDGNHAERQPVALPTTLLDQVQLYKHQIDGFEQMLDLYADNERNGVLLADDMGLGKTLQLITLMLKIKETNKNPKYLIVAPTILMDNWKEEIAMFTQGGALTMNNPLSGSQAKTPDEMSSVIQGLEQNDITITTYESLKINQILLGKIHWTVMICDEIQKAKNPKTQIGHAIKTQNADFKVACTATPIENSTEDLWNIIDYSKPGLLGSLKEFRNRYVQKVKQLDDQTHDSRSIIESEIKGTLSGYVIRRQKKDILADQLPKKHIIVEYVLASKLERQYIQEVNQLRTLGEPALCIVGHLLRICAHPYMYRAHPEHVSHIINDSSKMKWLIETLKDIQKKQEKVLIFADFHKIQEYIIDAIADKLDLVPNVINGKTSESKRKQLLERFKTSEGFNVIVLSTEVAGVGLTIREANHVIHYHRKWNPAKENQATDRVYRIGQDKDVYVYLPVISYDETKREHFETFEDYVDAYDAYDARGKSPDEKLNQLLVAKNKLLSNFFYAINEKDFVPDYNQFLDEEIAIQPHISMDKVDTLDGYEFEALMCAIFNRKGYETHLTQQSGDEGVDIILRKDNGLSLVQCKKSGTEKLSEDAIHSVIAAEQKLTHNFVDLKVEEIILCTTAKGRTKALNKTMNHSKYVFYGRENLMQDVKLFQISYGELEKYRRSARPTQTIISCYYSRK